jgi:enoyl-CoA hydratase
MAELLVERADRIVTLVLHRPDRLNAVTAELYHGLIEALDRASADPAVRAVVLAGAGRAFCVGADLKAHGTAERSESERRRYAQFGQDAAAAILRCDKPVVGAVHGHAIGAGLELVLACDLTVVAADAKLRFPELALGTFVGGGTTFTLIERVGMTRAKGLLLLGRFFTGHDAAAWGLCNEAVPAAAVPQRARELALEAAAMAPRSVAFCKRLLRQARDRTLAEALAAEADALAACMGTRDWHEGIDAFRERRPPRFTGE